MKPETEGFIVGMVLGGFLVYGTAVALYFALRPRIIATIGPVLASKLRGTQLGPLLGAAGAPGVSDAIGAAASETLDRTLP